MSKVRGAGTLKQPLLEAERQSKERQKERRKRNTALVESMFETFNKIFGYELPPLLFMVLSMQEVVACLLSRLADKWFPLSNYS